MEITLSSSPHPSQVSFSSLSGNGTSVLPAPGERSQNPCWLPHLCCPSWSTRVKHQILDLLLPYPVVPQIPAAECVLHHEIRLSAPTLSKFSFQNFQWFPWDFCLPLMHFMLWLSRRFLLPELHFMSLGLIPPVTDHASCPLSCVSSPHPICQSRPKQVPCLPWSSVSHWASLCWPFACLFLSQHCLLHAISVLLYSD